MLTAGLKRTRSPSASNGDQAGEISPAPVQGSSKDIDGSHGQDNDENGWTSVSGSSKKKVKKQKTKKLEVGRLLFFSLRQSLACGQNPLIVMLILQCASSQMATPLFHFDPAGFKHRQIQVSVSCL